VVHAAAGVDHSTLPCHLQERIKLSLCGGMANALSCEFDPRLRKPTDAAVKRKSAAWYARAHFHTHTHLHTLRNMLGNTATAAHAHTQAHTCEHTLVLSGTQARENGPVPDAK
jgi:hypothetical protein